ncbi:MAG: exo-1,3-beta-glucanase [Bathelium mastoideum]|nr:MAG: exo-1,3-beta-glucanase [Bathelium mastoideum]
MIIKKAIGVSLAAALAIAAPAPAPSSNWAKGLDFGTEITRGVNLGGWLVLEAWITPSIFQKFPASEGIVDEYTLSQKLGNQTAHDTILKPHWDSWVTQDDFNKISSYGFNVVRIPIGYWAYASYGEPFASGAAPYLDKAIDWARNAQPKALKVIVDLHGAPLSQNGFDNSGQRILAPGKPGWQGGDSVNQTLAVLKILSEKYAVPANQDVVAGIELLNEPLSPDLNLDELYSFYQSGFETVRNVSDSTVVLQDAFRNANTWNGFLTPGDGGDQHVAVDHHEYQVFNNWQVALQPWQHRQYVCNGAVNYGGADKWTLVGEWTAAMTDCATWLNGYGTESRFEGKFDGSPVVGSCGTINDISTWNQTLKDDTRGYIEAQMEVYEATTRGWIFWNFKTENAAEWDMYKLVDANVFPQPLTARKFGAICTSIS